MQNIFITSVLCTCSLAVSVSGTSTLSEKYSLRTTACFYNAALLTVWNVSVRRCVVECQTRHACVAVDYWRRGRVCELKTTVAGWNYPAYGITRPCVNTQTQNLTTCQACDDTTMCDPATGSCSIKECRKLDIDNAVIMGNGLSIGSKVVITCKASHALVPEEPVSVCQSDGTWSYEPKCIVDCGEPPTVDNASVDLYLGATLLDDVRSYTCNNGYSHLNNPPTTSVTCQLDGMWSAVMFACLIVCGEPPVVSNADVSPGGVTEGDIRQYSCVSGYTILPADCNGEVQCNSDGMWSSVGFQCAADCGTPRTEPNADVNNGETTEASIRSYTCHSGYIAQSWVSMDITCGASGYWTSAVFQCQAILCGEPPVVSNAVVSQGGETVGDIREYTCVTGYTIFPASSDGKIQCNSDGIWSSVAFQCIADCGTPPNEPNANVNSGGTTETSIRSYTCHSGYSADSTVSMDITCRASGDWSSAAFHCLAIRTCTSGWYQIDNSCYYSSTSYRRNFQECQKYCSDMGGYLIQLETETENTAVKDYLLSTYGSDTWWINLSAASGSWRWQESSQTPTFYDWRPGHPGSANNVVLSGAKDWSTMNSANSFLPLCEKSAQPVA